MTLIWSPPLTAPEARWRGLAHDWARQAGAEDSAAAAAAIGLLRMFTPRRQPGLAASVPAMLGAIEATASALPRLSTVLANVMGAATALVRLGNARQRKTWLGDLIESARPPLLLIGSGTGAAGEPEFAATPEADAWALRGHGFAVAGPESSGALLLFAATPQGRGGHGVSAFLMPWDTPGISVGAQGEGEATRRAISLDVRLAHDLLLGEAGAAQTAFEQIEALRRIAAAAQATGAALTAYEEACRAVRAEATSHASAPTRSALKLASCASALSAARMMLYESARATEAGENVGLLGAMAMLSATECCDQTIAAGLQIASAKPLSDFVRLHALLHARQIHSVTAGSADAQAALLAGAIAPAPRHHRGAASTMSRNSSSRAGESPDRVVEILDAAADAFTQQSYDATTLDYIGDAIGVTKGSIYYHYRSKADLFAAVYQRAMEMNIDTVTPISNQPGVRAIDRLYRMVYAHALQVMRHLSYQRVAVQGLEAHLLGRVSEEQRTRLNEVIALRDTYEQLFLRAIEEAIDAGELPQQSARMAVKPLFGAINHTTMWYQPRPGETATDRDRIAGYLATFVISGFQRSYQPAPMDATEANEAAPH
jgi:AcrR family transcriptional regulator/alkylation response protein AidB-like acyl-CoA dehydrogenase